MRKKLLLFIIIIVEQTKAQTWVTIPDTNFANALQYIIPGAMNGHQINTSSPIVTTSTYSINVYAKNISNLNGIQYFSSLTYLNCGHNQITTLSNIPNTVTFLECGNNQITTIITLPTSLKYLYCGTNRLTNLPALPISLIYIDCSFDSLTHLPALPSGLQTLDCLNNYLSGLPALSDSLKYINCDHNLLASLPVLPSKLQDLQCGNNNINCFPFFPSSITSITIKPNPFNCLPNYIKAMGSDTVTYPLCATGNSNGCVIATDIVLVKDINTQINIYPNPVSSKVTVDANDLSDVKLFDVMGKQIISTKKNQIDMSNLSDGVYFIEVKANQNTSTHKIIVQH